MTRRYRFVGPVPVVVGPLGRVEPGEVVEAPVAIRHPHFVPVSPRARTRPAKPPFIPHFPEEALPDDDH